MKRPIVAVLLLASGIAAGQENFDFQNFGSSSGRVFIIGNFAESVGAVQAGAAQPANRNEPPLVLSPSLFDEQHSLVDVEGYGVRLPAEQFSLPEP